MIFHFVVPGDPIPWARPRIQRRGRYLHFFERDEVTAYRRKIALAALTSRRGGELFDGPLAIRLDFYLPRPKRLMGKKSSDGVIPCPVKPDLDNFCKAILDALKDIVFHDDGQVVTLEARKNYVEKRGQPRTVVELSRWDNGREKP